MLFAFIGCSNTESALKTTESPSCPTVVEGFFHSGETWIGKPPEIKGSAICVKREPDADPKTIYGKIIGADDKGIRFLPKRAGLYQPDSAYYTFDQVVWAIDKDGKAIRGEVPKGVKKVVWSMEIEISNIDQPEAKHITMELDPNERFSYCLNPGTYIVKKISYNADAGSGEECKDESDSLPNVTMNVNPFVINYIGDLYLDLRADTLPNVYSLPTIILKRPGYDVGMQFGLIGALAYESTIERPPTHTFSVEDDSTEAASNQVHWKTSLLSIQDTSSHYLRK